MAGPDLSDSAEMAGPDLSDSAEMAGPDLSDPAEFVEALSMTVGIPPLLQ
jgi:hypothetical protein